MKYINLYLEGFKPLLHGGTQQLEFNNMTQIVVLSGENGKGKSSVLRELSPYPATRTDYEKNGKKVLEIEHQGKNYVLTSDFSKTGAHSFKQNGIELNLSGTTEVQVDLVNQYFDGFTTIVEKLTSGQCKISQLSRPERSKLIMATYPSPMLFVLEKYKSLMTKIRAANNQLKLLQERKLKLKEGFIDDSALKKHNDMRQLMNESINALDADIFMLNQSIKPYEEHPLYNKEIEWSIDDVMTDCLNFKQDVNLIAKELGPDKMLAGDKLKSELYLIEYDLEALKDRIDSSQKRGKGLVEQIDKYKNYLNTDRDKNIKECEQMIQTQKDIIREFTIEDDTPTVDIEEAQQMRDNASTVQENLDYLKSLSIELWSEDKFIETERKMHLIEADVRSQLIEQSKIVADGQKIQLKLEKHKKYSYPSDCHVKCQLRSSFEEVINSTQTELDELKSSYKTLQKEIDENNRRIEELKKDLELRSPARPLIRRYEQLTTNKYWGNFICSDLSFVNAANLNITEIWNRYTKIIKKSEAHDKVKRAKDNLMILEAKLAHLKADTQPAKQIITETLIQLESDLQAITQERAKMQQELESQSVRQKLLTRHKDLVECMNLLKSRWEELRTHIELTESVKFVKTIVGEMVQTKMQISEKLRELDTIVHEQENLRTRLQDEIEPMIEKLTEDLRKWQVVEKQLSPTKGLPNRLLIKYINEIFKLANSFIERVWNYDMQLELLKEDEELDFTFRVMLNGDDFVKDVSICSKGQKEIIDLAVMLGICTYRKYSGLFPLKLDEMTSGLSPDHCNKLFDYLGELLHRSDIMQTFIVNHDPVTSSVYADASYAVLSQDYPLPANCQVISRLK